MPPPPAMAARRSPHPDSAPFLSRADRTEEDEEEDEGPEEEEQDEGGGGPAPLGEAETAAITGVSGRRARLMVAVLCYVNLLNYMDRFTVAGTARRGHTCWRGWVRGGRPREDKASGSRGSSACPERTLLEEPCGAQEGEGPRGGAGRRCPSHPPLLPAGVLPEIEAYFGIGDGSSGLLQTGEGGGSPTREAGAGQGRAAPLPRPLTPPRPAVFISSYMVLAPLFGFLGDRSSRRLLLCVGIALWSTVTLASSFVPRQVGAGGHPLSGSTGGMYPPALTVPAPASSQHFWLLLLTRGLVGVGEASYSTVAPTIIADLFVGDRRSRMLGFFYFAIPVGRSGRGLAGTGWGRGHRGAVADPPASFHCSGLGYMAGSKVKDVMHDWHWALRVSWGGAEAALYPLPLA